MRLCLAVIAVAFAVTGCRAPGEPPSHPTRSEYQDLIRRELDAAGSAVSTCVLVLRYVDENRVPAPYIRVVLRQAANDLRKVAQDLSQITPPPGDASAQTALLLLTQRDRDRLDDLAGHLRDASARDVVRGALSRDSNTLDNQLTPKLDPA